MNAAAPPCTRHQLRIIAANQDPSTRCVDSLAHGHVTARRLSNLRNVFEVFVLERGAVVATYVSGQRVA